MGTHPIQGGRRHTPLRGGQRLHRVKEVSFGFPVLSLPLSLAPTPHPQLYLAPSCWRPGAKNYYL